MHGEELDDWAGSARPGKPIEKRLRDPDDVFIHAEERRREINKKAKRKTKKQANAQRSMGHR